MKAVIEIAILVALFTETLSECLSESLPHCQELRNVDPESPFRRKPQDRCRVIRGCLKQQPITHEIKSSLIRCLTRLTLDCTDVNSDQDQFHHGCDDVELLRCQTQIQEQLTKEAEDKGHDRDLMLCKAHDWTNYCMVENASCAKVYVDAVTEESKEIHGLKCSAPALSSTFIVTMAVMLFASPIGHR